jgi:signal transduction histidine kinase
MTPALGFAPWLRIDGPVEARVPPDVAEAVLAVVREGLSNAARHARAGHVDVVIMTSNDLSVVVQDNGTGIRPGQRWSGLANLTNRAAELGGSLSVAPGEAGGTRLVWRVPLPGVRV